MSSRDLGPEGDASDLDGGEERGGVLGVSGCDAAPSFEMEEGVFNQVALLVQVFVLRPLRRSVCSRRDDRRHSLLFGLFDDRIAGISFVGDQAIGSHALDQAASLRAIRCGTLRDNNSERHTMRIHGQVYLGVKPPFVRLMS